MKGIVLEGGSFRGIFTAGVLDALLEHDIYLPYCIGVSAGITNGVSYISKQVGRNLKVLTTYRHDKRYFSKRNLIKCKSVFGLEFAYNEIPNKLEKFDWDTYKAYPGKVVVVTTNALTGKAQYFNGIKMDKNCTLLRATCALPIVFPTIKIKGTPHYDGGLSDPIPVKRALKDGCDKLIIVLTRPQGYIKEVSFSSKVISKALKHRYPKVAELLLTRHIGYNESVKYAEQLEREGKAYIIRPSRPLESFEKDVKKIEENYKLGYDYVDTHIERIQAFLGEEISEEVLEKEDKPNEALQTKRVERRWYYGN